MFGIIGRFVPSTWWLLAFGERGYPDLPAFGTWHGYINGLVRPNFDIDNSRPLRGAKPRDADDAKTSRRSGLLRLAPEEWRFLCEPSPREAWTLARVLDALLTMMGHTDLPA